MKQKFSLMLGACAMALASMTSCSSDDMLEETSNNTNEALSVVATVEGLATTRATDAAWEAGDSIGITAGNIATNVKYVSTEGDGTFSAADAGIYFTDRTSYVFYAYYPYNSGITSGRLIFNVCDSANVAAQKRNDIMVANGTASASKPTLQLQFKHAMVRLIINVKTSTEDGFDADDVFSSNCSAMIGTIYTQCLFNANMASVSGYGSLGDLNLVAPTDNRETHVRQYVVYVAPQSGRKFYLFFNRGTDNQQCYSVQLTNEAWKVGQSYTYNITAKRGCLDLSSASTITEWTDVTSDLDADLN
jgi:hypothetical protein